MMDVVTHFCVMCNAIYLYDVMDVMTHFCIMDNVIHLFDALHPRYIILDVHSFFKLQLCFLLNCHSNAYSELLPTSSCTLYQNHGDYCLHLHSSLKQSPLLILLLSLCLCLPSLPTDCLPFQLFHLSCFSLSSLSVINFVVIYCIIYYHLCCDYGAHCTFYLLIFYTNWEWVHTSCITHHIFCHYN